MPSDSDLIERIREHDPQAFEMLFERYEDAISRHVAQVVRSDSTAQDLVQEVFLRVWTHAAQWNGRGPFRAWLYRIATNLALNRLRAARRRREQPLEVEDQRGEDEEQGLVPEWMIDESALGPDSLLDETEQRERILRLVGRLPEDKREVLHLVHEMEMSIRDAADELGIPEGTVKSRLYYARKRLARDWLDLKARWEEL